MATDPPADDAPREPGPAANTSAAAGVSSYRFTAQPILQDAGADRRSAAGEVSGSIDASDPEAAHAQLASLRLRVLNLEPAQDTGRSRAVRGGDFLAFNQQLAYMTQAGLPMEQGLRLIARDLKGGRLSKTIQQVADELEAGKALPEAFAAHKGAFPPLYSAVIEAGVRTGNLSGVLMGLGQHLELMQRLRAAIWRAAAYPLVVFFGVVLLLCVLGWWIVPQFRAIYSDFDDFGTELPLMTELVLDLSRAMPVVIIAVAGLGIATFVGLGLLRAAGREQRVMDLLRWVPLIGPAVRRNLISRWCDTLRLGIKAGLDLPEALRLAAGTLDSGPLTRDTQTMIDAVEQGRPIHRNLALRFVPEAVPASIELAAHADDLPSMLRDLSDLYRRQAEARIAALHMILGPILLVFVAVIIGTVISALFLPMLQLMEWLM